MEQHVDNQENSSIAASSSFNSSAPSKEVAKYDYILKLIEIIPKIGWLLVTIVLLIFLFPELKSVISKVNSFKGYGIEVELKTSIEKYNKNIVRSNKDSIITIQSQEQIVNRVQLLTPYLKDREYKILWVDDHPENNVYVAKILEEIGLTIEPVTKSDAALELLSQAKQDTTLQQYNLVITDFGKDDMHEINGEQFANKLKYIDYFLPVIIYSSSYQPGENGMPYTIFASANRPDYLINYVLDVIERGGTPFPKDTSKN